jgi:hypothetical protein
MNVEQRLVEAFQTSPPIEPAPDLFSRVVHSIEEDRRHRRRVVRTWALCLAATAAVVTVGALSTVDGRFGRYVRLPTMEALEAIVLVTVIVSLGPAIRRFGRNYAADLWPRGATIPGALLRLLDLAFYLVGAGYVLVTTEFRTEPLFGRIVLADQLADAAIRIGLLLLVLGLLHAATLMVLPLIALIDNSTRRGVAVPRWVWLWLIVLATQVLPFLPLVVGIGAAGGE